MLSGRLGEFGDPARFENPRQMSRKAGYNLVEGSSGKKQKRDKDIQTWKNEPAESALPDSADNGWDK